MARSMRGPAIHDCSDVHTNLTLRPTCAALGLLTSPTSDTGGFRRSPALRVNRRTERHFYRLLDLPQRSIHARLLACVFLHLKLYTDAINHSVSAGRRPGVVFYSRSSSWRRPVVAFRSRGPCCTLGGDVPSLFSTPVVQRSANARYNRR